MNRDESVTENKNLENFNERISCSGILRMKTKNRYFKLPNLASFQICKCMENKKNFFVRRCIFQRGKERYDSMKELSSSFPGEWLFETNTLALAA